MTSRLCAALAVLLLPQASLGQTPGTTDVTGSLSVEIAAGNAAFVNRDECLSGEGTAVTVSYPSGVGTTLTVFVSEQSSCPDEPGTSTVLLSPTTLNSSNATQTILVSADEVGGEKCPEDTTKDVRICAVATQKVTDLTGKTDDQVVASDDVVVTYDSEPPAAPQIEEATGGEQSVQLSWTGEDVDHFLVYHRPVGEAPTGEESPCGLAAAASALTFDDGGTGDAGADAGAADGGAADAGVSEAGPPIDTSLYSQTEVDGAARKTTVDGLVNGQRYEFFMVAVDGAGNQSAQGNLIEGLPRVVQDFYERYRCAGGAEQGGFGCSAGGAPIPPLLAALAAAGLLAGLRRRR